MTQEQKEQLLRDMEHIRGLAEGVVRHHEDPGEVRWKIDQIAAAVNRAAEVNPYPPRAST